jgi:hypothetical protein
MAAHQGLHVRAHARTRCTRVARTPFRTCPRTCALPPAHTCTRKRVLLRRAAPPRTCTCTHLRVAAADAHACACAPVARFRTHTCTHTHTRIRTCACRRTCARVHTWVHAHLRLRARPPARVPAREACRTRGGPARAFRASGRGHCRRLSCVHARMSVAAAAAAAGAARALRRRGAATRRRPASARACRVPATSRSHVAPRHRTHRAGWLESPGAFPGDEPR